MNGLEMPRARAAQTRGHRVEFRLPTASAAVNVPVAHVAAVELKGDHPGSGYEAVSGEYISLCVTNVLKEIDKSNRNWGRKTLRTVIMPLIGSYASPHLAEVNIGCMVRALVEYFLSDTGQASLIEGVALLGYTDEDERLIRKAFGRDTRLQRLPGDPTESL